MVTEQAETKKPNYRKLFSQITVGAAVGGVFGYFTAISAITSDASADQVALLAVGLMYLVMGLFCGAGVAFPRLGAKMLNVEDVDELREQRRVLTGSAVAMTALGAAMMLLPSALEGGWLDPGLALAMLVASMVISGVITARDWSHYDELMWKVSNTSGSIAYVGVGGLMMIWSAAAALGFAGPLTPLAIIALLMGGMLAAVVVASARVGLMMPR